MSENILVSYGNGKISVSPNLMIFFVERANAEFNSLSLYIKFSAVTC